MSATRTWIGAVLAAGIAPLAVGCATPEVSGRVKLVYHSTAETGKAVDRNERGEETHKVYPGLRMTFVNVSNDAYVGKDGEPITTDDTVKIVSNARMAELLEAIDDAGFAGQASAGQLDAALDGGAREVIALDHNGTATLVVEPSRPLNTEAKREAMQAFVRMKQILYHEQQNHTQFHVVGQGRDRPSWAPAPR